jgi:hypothetical protein
MNHYIVCDTEINMKQNTAQGEIVLDSYNDVVLSIEEAVKESGHGLI